MRNANIAGIVALLMAIPALVAAGPAELQPLAFLVGEWVASGTGQPGAGTGTAVFSPSLQDRVILRTSYAEYPPADGKPGSRHDDLMVIYVGIGGQVRADYYDNEGHVIRYAVQSPRSRKEELPGRAGGSSLHAPPSACIVVAAKQADCALPARLIRPEMSRL